jgi:aldehyde:ferredoxin oxidoreductase
MEVGERSLNLMRLYNYKIKGWDAKDDRFAGKLAYEEGEVGIYKGKIVPWDDILQEYYKLRGWTPRGLPAKERLTELKMDSVLANVELPVE